MKFHTRLAFFMTIALLAIGTVLILVMEWSNESGLTLGNLSISEKLNASLFQSMSLRTAGMNSIDLLKMRDCTKVVCVILMFIGAGAGSTGGGIKVQAFALLISSVKNDIMGKNEVVIRNHRVTRSTVQRALTIFSLGFSLVLILTCILSVTERQLIASGQFSFLDVLFEGASAFGTVGLSSAATPQFSFWGQLAIIPVMFLGRVGPLTFAMGLVTKERKSYQSIYPEAKIHLG
jgi:trk system potassium uptake protein TrkH